MSYISAVNCGSIPDVYPKNPLAIGYIQNEVLGINLSVASSAANTTTVFSITPPAGTYMFYSTLLLASGLVEFDIAAMSATSTYLLANGVQPSSSIFERTGNTVGLSINISGVVHCDGIDLFRIVVIGETSTGVNYSVMSTSFLQLVKLC
jgi:hypothetical protein